MTYTRIIFICLLLSILCSTHYYLYKRISYYFQLTGNHNLIAGSIIGLLLGLILFMAFYMRNLPAPAATFLGWIVYPWMGILLLTFVTLMAIDTAWFIAQLITHNNALILMPNLKLYSGLVALSISLILSSYALWHGLQPAIVKPVTVKLKRLPKALDGFKIVQVTDLHIGPLIKGDWLQQVVQKINQLKPDLIVITGDLVDGSVAELSQHIAPLKTLHAPNGIFFVTGNHEYYSGVEEWCRYLPTLNIKVLRNERVLINASNPHASFELAGVEDWGSHAADLPKALAARDLDKMLILLAHQPAAATEAALHKVDLQLSGHTHGGQIWPFNYLVYLQQPYLKGLYRHEKSETQVYVSAGTGFWGPPMRLGTTAEITLLTLQYEENN